MPATTTLLGLVTPTQGTLTGTWGDTVNYGISDYLDIAIAGTLSFAGDGAITLANTTGSSAGNSIGATTAQYAIIRVTGTLTTVKIITGPSYSKTYLVVNAATGSTVTFKASGQTGVSIAVGETALVYYNGTDYVKVVGTATAGAAGGSTTQVQYNNAGVLAGITGATSNGTALTLVAPVLGAATATSLQGIIGNVTPAAGSFTTLGASSTATLNTLVSSGATLTGGTINGMTVGATTAAAGAFTTVTATTSVTTPSVMTSGATALLLRPNGVTRMTIGTDGDPITTAVPLAVTGTLSATGTLSGGTSGTAYSFSGSAPANSLALDASGLLGIGFTSPAQKLHVSGAIVSVNGVSDYPSNADYCVFTYTSNNGSGVYPFNSNGNLVIQPRTSAARDIVFATGSTTPTTRAVIDSSGNLLVGKTTADGNAKLDVNGSIKAIFSLKAKNNASNISYYEFEENASLLSYSYIGGDARSTGFLNFSTNATEKMRLDSSGNLLVGTTSASQSVVGIRAYIDRGSVSGYNSLAVTSSQTSNTESCYDLYSTGASAYRFYVGLGGTIFATSIVITAISDERLKENVRDIDTGLDSIMALKPRRFDWKEGKGQDKKDVAGFIAQEFEDVFPECVSTSKAGADGIEYKNINHETLIPTLVKAVQEQQALITTLTARITALETA